MSTPQNETLKRTLGMREAVTITVGTVVGVGLFTTGAQIVGSMGSAVILATFMAMVISVYPSHLYAEMSAALPFAGGTYKYAQLGLGKAAGMLAGWNFIASLVAVPSGEALAFSFYFKTLFRAFGVELPISDVLLAAIPIVLFIVTNIHGTEMTGRLQNGFMFFFWGVAIIWALMMIPNELVIITNFVTITDAGLRNTFWGLILPSVTSVFYIYLLKENFAQIPDELYYAAKVDGTSDFKYLWKVMLPICRPTVVTIVILKVIECWNSYVWPRLITDDENYFLVSNGIQAIRENGFGRENIPAMMAAVVVISVPLIVLFLLFRNKVMEGVSRGGTKG